MKHPLSPDGNPAYVAASFDIARVWYARNASTGALTYGGVLRTERMEWTTLVPGA